jgi:hypothetical protein
MARLAPWVCAHRVPDSLAPSRFKSLTVARVSRPCPRFSNPGRADLIPLAPRYLAAFNARLIAAQPAA